MQSKTDDITPKLIDYLLFSQNNNRNILINNKSAIIFESTSNLEAVYISNIFFKFNGCTDIQYSNFKLQLNSDLPNFFNLNRSFASFEKLTSLLIMGSNPRYEASVLNSFLRIQQNSKSLSYYSISPSLDCKLKTLQEGNGFRSLGGLLENRLNLTKKLYSEIKPSILVGADSLKNKNGLILQNIFRFIAKKLYVKNIREDRLAILHKNIASLNILNLGLDLSVRSDLYLDSQVSSNLSNLIVIQPYKVTQSKWISNRWNSKVITFATHESAAIDSDLSFPIASLYENKGTTFNIEGRLKQFYPAVQKPQFVSSLEETLLSAFFMVVSDIEKVGLLKNLRLFWLEICGAFLKKKSKKRDDISLEVQNSNNDMNFEINLNYFLNYYTWEEPAKKINLSLFSVLVEDFYMSDLISENSMTMGHAALFSQSVFSEYLKSI